MISPERSRELLRAYAASEVTVGHGPLAGVGNQSRIFGEDAAGVAGLWLPPFGEAGFDFRGGDTKRDAALHTVDGDRVAVFHDGNGTAVEGLGRDVADDEAVAAAA